MKRTTSSDRPLAIVSDSMSVTKPALYLRSRARSISRFSWVMSVPRQLQGDGLALAGRTAHLRQADAAQRVGDHVVDVAPVAAHAAVGLDLAGAVLARAFGHAERAFDGLDDLDQADALGRAREAIAAGAAAEA